MFSVLAVGYLFLGGAGAGAVAAAATLDLVWVKAPFGAASRTSIDEATPAERVVAAGFLVGFAALSLGALCLVLDLGRVDRVADLFLRPSFSLVAVGAYALAALVACSAFLAAVRFAYLPHVRCEVVRIVEAAVAAIGVVVMLYTGLLLQSMGSVVLWDSPLVPTLFVLSSLSCGMAVLLVAALFVDADADSERLARVLARVDAVVILLEGAMAAALVACALTSGASAAAESAARLVEGDQAVWWWVGFVLLGLVVPLALEAAVVVRRTPAPLFALRVALAVGAVLVLVGGFSMRSAIVEAGTHRALELEEPSAQAQSLRLE